MLQDARGCLTEAGMRALESAPPGQAPPELAAHVAACPRCQDRLLAALRARGAAPARRPPASRLWLGLALVLGALLLALGSLAAGRLLSR